MTSYSGVCLDLICCCVVFAVVANRPKIEDEDEAEETEKTAAEGSLFTFCTVAKTRCTSHRTNYRKTGTARAEPQLRSTQPSIPQGRQIEHQLLVGVKLGCVHLCRMTGITM